MQIGIIGNTNNYPFLLGEGLRSIGVNVRLVLTRRDRSHHPVHAGLTPDGLPDWVFDASDAGVDAFELQRPSIGPALDFVLHEADVVILNDMAPSLHNLLHLPVVSQLTGVDLTHYASEASSAVRRPGWTSMDIALWEEMVVRQRAGIRRSRFVSYPWPSLIAQGDAVLDQIGVEDGRRVFLAYADTQRVRPSPPPAGPSLNILNAAQLDWGRPAAGLADPEAEGTDGLLHGFRKFLDMGGRGDLTLIEAGPHVGETKDLARTLGLDDHLVWKTEMSLAELYREMEGADVVCCRFGEAAPGMTAFAAMAAARPVLANFRLDILARHDPEPWPVCDTQSADQTAEHLLRLHQDPAHRDRLGAEARRFAEIWLSPQSAARTFLTRLPKEGRIHRLEAEHTEQSEEIRLLRRLAAFGPEPSWGKTSASFSVLELDPSNMDGPDGALWTINAQAAPEGDSPEDPCRSAAILLEDGVPLGPAHAVHARIREEGGGRYSHWRRELLFSTSDGSSPKDNRRQYTLRFPARAWS